jgi:CRISPR-associated protein (TIGR03986 family)
MNEPASLLSSNVHAPQVQNIVQHRCASAPYNFVRLPERIVLAPGLPCSVTYADPVFRHTGYFQVLLVTKSPVYVRCAPTLTQFRNGRNNLDVEGNPLNASSDFTKLVKNLPDFFPTKDALPVIPGSTLRGMLRSVVEIAAYAKVERVRRRPLYFRSVDTKTSLGEHYHSQMTGNVQAGFLRARGTDYIIVPTQYTQVPHQLLKTLGALHIFASGTSGLKIPNPIHEGRRVYIAMNHAGELPRRLDSSTFSLISKENFRRAQLVVTGDIPGRKNHEFVFVIPEGQTLHHICVPDQVIRDFNHDDQITRWQEQAFPKHRGERIRAGALLSYPGGFEQPVFYCCDEAGSVTAVGRAQMFRIKYPVSPQDLIPNRLRCSVELDLADALFGFVQPKQVGDRVVPASAGRVCVESARLVDTHLPQNSLWLNGHEPVRAKILASPKPTCYPHYLEQVQTQKDRLTHYATEQPSPIIRGHKRYWNQGDQTASDLTDAGTQHDTQRTWFRPVRKDVAFSFRIWFENLSSIELGALCWALHPSASPQIPGPFVHHIGMGKPLGMGTVELNATLHLENRGERYQSLFSGDSWSSGEIRIHSLREQSELAALTKPFESHVSTELGYGPERRLVELPRIQELLLLMRGKGFPRDEKGGTYLPDQRRPNTRMMTLKEFNEKKVLPPPADFASGL